MNSKYGKFTVSDGVAEGVYSKIQVESQGLS
jgi:hypothetical protein